MQNWRQTKAMQALAVLGVAICCASNSARGDCVPGWDQSIGQPGLNNTARAVASYNGKIVIGGQFNSPQDKVMYWDGSTWGSLGQMTDPGGAVAYNMTVYNGELIVGGRFETVGGVVVNNIARWNGSSWQSLGSGVAGGSNPSTIDVREMYEWNGDLYVGGDFTSAGGVPALNIARWDGTSWHALTGGGVNNDVYTLTEYDGELIAGGNFTVAGAQLCNGIARWNGTNWLPLGDGSGPGAWVMEVLEFQGDLIVVGSFTTAGGAVSSNIQRWDGTSWHAMSANNWAEELLIFDGKLVVAGGFTNIGGVSANRIATWDGTTWSAIQGGANNWIAGMTIHNQQLVVAGQFTTINGQTANRIARLGSVGDGPDLALSPTTAVVLEGSTVVFTAAGAGATSYQWRRDGAELVDGGNISGATTTTLTITNASTADIGAYYAEISNACGSILSLPAALGIEFAPADTCLADIVSSRTFQPPPDGKVDGADLAFLLGAWGTCE